MHDKNKNVFLLNKFVVKCGMSDDILRTTLQDLYFSQLKNEKKLKENQKS